MKKVLMIVGSMRKKSFNRQLAAIAAELLRGKAEVSFLEYADIPYMNQDIEFPVPEEIARVREEVSRADGIWIITPEYNYSYPGVLKNLLDLPPHKDGSSKNRNSHCRQKSDNQRCRREKCYSECKSKTKRSFAVYAGRSDGRMRDRCGVGCERISDKCLESI